MQSRSLHPTDAEHKGFGHSPTSILQRKKCFCIDENIACRCRRCIYVCPACWYQLAIFWIRFFKSDFKNTCWASPKPDVPHKIALATLFRWYRISKFSWRKIRFEKISVDSFNIASNRNYYFRFWRQKAEVMLPKNLSDFMVCSFQSRSHEPDLPSPVFSLKTGPDTS